MDKITPILAILFMLFVVGFIGYAIYRGATDPCRCVAQSCETSLVLVSDANGKMTPQEMEFCTCTKKECPAERP